MKTLIWGRQIGIFNIRSSFSNATMSFYFSIRDLFKLLPIFPCHIIILIIIVLNLLLCGNLNSILLTKSFFCFYKFHILYWVLITIYFTCGFAKVILSGDVELNPGPKPNSVQNFSVWDWNMNSIPAHNFFENFTS